MDVDLVIGIPTVKRETKNYLNVTLTSMFANMDGDDRNRSLVVVFIGDANLTTVNETLTSLMTDFEEEIEEGLLEVVVPSPLFYPNLSLVR